MAFCLVVMTLAISASVAMAQADSNIRVGLGGNIRLGKWTPIFLDNSVASDAIRFETEALDGDDTPIVYSGDLLTDPQNPDRRQAWIRIGRTYGRVELRLFDAQDEEVANFDISLRGEGRSAEILKSTREQILTLEPETRFRDAIASVSAIGAAEDKRVVTAIGIDGDLPLNWLGYDNVETVLLVTSDLKRVEQISDRQLDALEAWVRKGGTLICSVAQNAEQLLGPEGKLARFCPGQFVSVGEFRNTSRLETFADSNEPLARKSGDSIACCKLDSIDGRVLIEDGTQPQVIEGAKGLGRVVFVAFDLDSERIIQWKGHTNLVNRLVSGAKRVEGDSGAKKSQRGSSVSHFGYKDMIGQLRVPLDKFTNVHFVKFALIAALISLYILCIGPGDYFLLKRVFKKMELTWLTFPLVSLIFCGLAIWISGMTRPNKIQLNQLEVIDVDSIDGRVRGSVWTNLYSPRGENCSLEIDPSHQLGFQIDSDLISWHGLPGDGLGGMYTSANPGLLKTSYRTAMELGENGQDIQTKISGLPLQVSSTKPLFMHWWADNPVRIRSRLKLNPRLQQLRGTVTNPFDFTLKNVRLVFENYVYLLDAPLKPGDAFDIQTETDEKTLRSMLTRKVKRSKNDRSDNSPWDPTDTRIRRIADMMMFFDAAGGENYTGLTHDYQPFVDMTNHVELQRAVLIGEIQEPGAMLKINGSKAADQYDQVTTIVRVVFPVEYLDEQSSK